MNKKLLPWLFVFIASFITACATTEPHPGHTAELKALMQNPRTVADHEALAAHYEEDAKIFKDKAADHKKLLNQFQREPWLYGKQSVGFAEHCKNLIRLESQTAEEDLEMAKIHRATADELKRQGSFK